MSTPKSTDMSRYTTHACRLCHVIWVINTAKPVKFFDPETCSYSKSTRQQKSNSISNFVLEQEEGLEEIFGEFYEICNVWFDHKSIAFSEEFTAMIQKKSFKLLKDFERSSLDRIDQMCPCDLHIEASKASWIAIDEEWDIVYKKIMSNFIRIEKFLDIHGVQCTLNCLQK